MGAQMRSRSAPKFSMVRLQPKEISVPSQSESSPQIRLQIKPFGVAMQKPSSHSLFSRQGCPKGSFIFGAPPSGPKLCLSLPPMEEDDESAPPGNIAPGSAGVPADVTGAGEPPDEEAFALFLSSSQPANQATTTIHTNPSGFCLRTLPSLRPQHCQSHSPE